MLRRRNKVFEKYAQVSSLQKQFRSWRAWTGITVLLSIASFFLTKDRKWHAGTILIAMYFGYQAFISHGKWLDCQKEVETSKLLQSSSQDLVSVDNTTKRAETNNVLLSPSSTTTPAVNKISTVSSSNRMTSGQMDSNQRTPIEPSNLRRRMPQRGQFDGLQSPDNHPENFSPDLARKFARQAMQSPDKLSPMTTSRAALSDNRFSTFPATPSMDTSMQERKPYHVSPLVTDTVRRNVSSAEPHRLDALQAIGMGSVPDEWVEKLKANLGAHLYAILKLHDQSVQYIKAFLKQQQEQGRVPPDTLAKVTPLLDHEVTYKSVKLDNGTMLSIDAILQFCAQPIAPAAPAATMPTTNFGSFQMSMSRPNPPQPGVSEDILQKYKAAWSFFKLCRHMQELIQQRPFPETSTGAMSSTGVNQAMFLGMPFTDNANLTATSKSSGSGSSSHVTSLVERLRQLQSSDRKLRIEWHSMSFSSRGGFGFGGRGSHGTRDFISGHQDYEMMDQDIVLALFLHRCDDHQTRIITTSTMQPQVFSDMHFVAHTEDMRQVLQHHHQELAATFDVTARSSGNNNNANTNGSSGSSRTTRVNQGVARQRDSSLSSASSTLLNIFLRNYPQPAEDPATGNTASNAVHAVHQAGHTSGRSISPHYDLLRFSSQVAHPSQHSQASWQHMSTMMATMSSSAANSGTAGTAPMFLSWFPQHKEILTIESGRNDIFEVIILFIVLMTLTAPANELEDESGRSGSIGEEEETHNSHHHHHHHHYQQQALSHVIALLEGNRHAMMGSEERSTVMNKLRRIFKLKGMGHGAAADARVVRSLFDEVIDVHELRHLMYEFHSLQQLQQQQSQQQQQLLAQQSSAGTSATAGAGGGNSAASAAANASSASGFMGAFSLGGMMMMGSGSNSHHGGGAAANSNSSSSSSSNNQSLGALLGTHHHHHHHHTPVQDPYYASSGGGSASLALLMPLDGGDSNNTPFRRTSSSNSNSSNHSMLHSASAASPLYSPPTNTIFFGRPGAGGNNNSSSSNSNNGNMFSPLGAAMTPITPGGGGGAAPMRGGSSSSSSSNNMGGGGSALRGFNSSFATESSFSMTAEKRNTPFAMR